MRLHIAAAFVALVGCGAPDEAGPSATDAGTVDAETPSVTDSGNPSADGGLVSDAPARPDATSATCSSDLVDTSVGADIKSVDGPAPAPAGGTIGDGTYVLTDYSVYGGSGGTQKVFGTQRFTPGSMEESFDRLQLTGRSSITASGTMLTITPLCRSDGKPEAARTVGYTATTTQYFEFELRSSKTHVKTFTKK